MILGVGIDIVEVSRIVEKLSGRDDFRAKVFSQREIAYCESVARPYESYAARFAAKEAFLKATGLGLTLTLDLSEVEVSQDEHGSPRIVLQGGLTDLAGSRGWSKIHVSLSHTKTAACAVVVLES